MDFLEILKEATPYLLSIGAVVLSGDALGGIVPDRWMPYIGLTRRIIRKLIAVKDAEKK